MRATRIKQMNRESQTIRQLKTIESKRDEMLYCKFQHVYQISSNYHITSSHHKVSLAVVSSQVLLKIIPASFFFLAALFLVVHARPNEKCTLLM